VNSLFRPSSLEEWLNTHTPDRVGPRAGSTGRIRGEIIMKRFMTAALLSSGLLFAAGAVPAFADPGDSGRYERSFKDGGYRDQGRGGYDRFEEAGHRHNRWNRGGWRRNCFWDRVCIRDRWGDKHCRYERVCRPRWW
jgi:hypothetical protein